MKEATKASILLVEDEENLQEALKLNLELEGYEVTAVDNGTAALKAVKNEYFDLIILDIMLPEMDGIAVCENIRIQNNEIPILFLSAKNSSADRVLGLKKGGDDYMTKPFNLEELLLRVEKLIVKNKKIQDKDSVPNVYRFGDNVIDFAAQECVGENGEAHEFSFPWEETSLTRRTATLPRRWPIWAWASVTPPQAISSASSGLLCNAMVWPTSCAATAGSPS